MMVDGIRNDVRFSQGFDFTYLTTRQSFAALVQTLSGFSSRLSGRRRVIEGPAARASLIV